MNMTTIDQMWTRLAQHQPEADRRGYGEAWRRMCEERTKDAADAAAEAAVDAALAADAAAEAAANAAWADKAANAARWAEQAIECIKKAEGET